MKRTRHRVIQDLLVQILSGMGYEVKKELYRIDLTAFKGDEFYTFEIVDDHNDFQKIKDDVALKPTKHFQVIVNRAYYEPTRSFLGGMVSDKIVLVDGVFEIDYSEEYLDSVKTHKDVNSQVEDFIKKTGKSERTFFRLKKKLKIDGQGRMKNDDKGRR